VPRKPSKPRPEAKARPQFDASPVLDDDEEEGACPIPDEHGEIVLRRSQAATKGGTRVKGKTKPRR
jgi:hypothetical protein